LKHIAYSNTNSPVIVVSVFIIQQVLGALLFVLRFQDYHTNALGLRLEARGKKLKDKDPEI
jgi:hypothetical protein